MLPPAPDPSYYADGLMIGYRDPDGDVRMADPPPKVTSSTGDINAAVLMDSDLRHSVSLPIVDDAEPAWVEFEFVQPFRARAFTIAGEGGGQYGAQAISDGQVQASQGGETL